MKKVVLFMAIASLFLAISVTDFSMAETRQPSIEITLKNDDTANVSYGSENFDIKYMRYNNHILVGSGKNEDLLRILNIASGMSQENYDIVLTKQAWDSSDYNVLLTAYDKDFKTPAIVNIDKSQIKTSMEFFTGGCRTNGYAFSFDDKSDGMPHLLGDYQYYLPLRYVFENLGYMVSYQNEKISITHQ